MTEYPRLHPSAEHVGVQHIRVAQIKEHIRCIVWSDYGQEGWQPAGFETVGDALDFMADGGYGVPMCLTEGLELHAAVAESEKKDDDEGGFLPNVTRVCEECTGSGLRTYIVGERRCVSGGPYEPIEVEVACDECAGTGLVVDDEWDVWADVLAEMKVTCSSGHRTIPDPPYRWWDEAAGFLVQCATCGTSVLIPRSELEYFEVLMEAIDDDAFGIASYAERIR